MRYPPTVVPRPVYSLPSILAVVCAIASFAAGAGWGLMLALAAIVLGLTGVLVALAPGVRGGLMSLVSIVAGALGVAAALLKVVF